MGVLAAMGQIGVWIALVFAEIAGAAVLWIYVKYRCTHSDGKLSDFYLIETNGSELLYDVSLKAAETEAAKLSQESISVFEAHGMDKVTAMKVGITLEEITAAKPFPSQKLYPRTRNQQHC